MVIVHTNTDKPYAEWIPTYVILSSWDKNWRAVWMPYGLYQFAKPEADKLIEEFWVKGRWGKRSTNVARWRIDICEAIATIINDNVDGIKCEVEYPPLEQNHCRVFHLVR